MSEMVSTIQAQLLQLLRDHRQASAESGYPRYLEPYAGQLQRPRQVDGTPAVYVDVPAQFEVSADDGGFNLLNMAGNPELVLFAENQASAEDTRSAIAGLIDWTIGALKGQTITINALPIPFERVTGRILTDYDLKMAVAVLTVILTSFED